VKGTFRYLVVATNRVQNLEEVLARAVMELWGLRGLAEVGVSVIEVKGDKGLAIVRVKREGLPLFRAAVAVHPEPILRVLKVTGTLKKAREIQSSIVNSSVP